MFCQFVTGRHFAHCAQCLNRNQIMEENKNIEETVEVKDRESQQAGFAEGKAGAEAKDGQENRKRKSRKEEKKEDEALRKQIEELSDKLAKEKDDYIRLMAEFETFRRRSSEEKLNMVASAAADTIKGLLPVLDDCERAMEILEKSSDDAAREGTSLIYTKLMDYLKTKGLARIEARGEVFDTDFHEAVTQFPAPSEDMKGKVIDVVQTGYTLNGKVLRYAKVHTCTLNAASGTYDLIVNATPCGMFPHTDECPLAEETVYRAGSVFDMIYNPQETKLLAAAHSAGVKTANGLTMLAGQAAAAETLWNGTVFTRGDILAAVDAAGKELEKK